MDIKRKYAYNIGTMFDDDNTVGTLGRRLHEANSAGFLSIEGAFPYSWSIEEWENELNSYPFSLELINTPLGPNKEPGLRLQREEGKGSWKESNKEFNTVKPWNVLDFI